MSVQPPSPPYLGPAAHTSSGSNKPVHRVVIHSTVSPCEPGGARDIAAYFRKEIAGGSAHYVVDPAEDVQVVFDSVIAWHAPPNPNSLGIEMCDIPGPVPNDKPGTAAFKAARRAWRWVKPNQRAMLRRTAKLTAQLCAAYDVPPTFLTVADLKAGKHGVTTHNNVSQAFHQSTHWDPGFWPRRLFMRMVRKHYRALTNPTPAPAPKPEPKPTPPPPPPPPPAPAPEPTPTPPAVSLEAEVVWGYNLRVGRRQKQVDGEIRAMLKRKPMYLALCEAITYDLPEVEGYSLMHDRSTKSRGNLARYVRDDVAPRHDGEWVDLTVEWKRTDHPGMHEPRSIYHEVLRNGVRMVVTHAPQKPNRKTDTRPARAEWVSAMKNLAARWRRPFILIGDWNGTGAEETSATVIAESLKGTVVGTRIDAAVVKGLYPTAATYPQQVGGVALLSDHKHALKFTVSSHEA